MKLQTTVCADLPACRNATIPYQNALHCDSQQINCSVRADVSFGPARDQSRLDLGIPVAMIPSD